MIQSEILEYKRDIVTMFAFYSRKMRADRLFILMSAAAALATGFVFAVNMVYQVQTVGLSPLQLVLVGTTLELAIFLFEIPTGVVADVYSRRLSIIIGFILTGLGFMTEGLSGTFGGILVGQVLWGIGYTFTSGAQEAWITDEVGESRVGPIFVQAAQIGTLVGIGAGLIAMLLGSWMVNLPIVLGGVLFIGFALFLVAVMPETGFTPVPPDERGRWAHMGDTLRTGAQAVRGSPALLAILGIGLFFGLYSEGFDRLNTAHLLESFSLPTLGGLQPVVWMNLIGLIGGLLAAGALHIARRRLDMSAGRALAQASALLTAGLVLLLAGFALAGSFALAVVLRWAITISRTLIEPIQTTWINQHVPSNVRATVISMSGQVDALGQIVGGPPVGLIGERLGIRAALLASAVILSPALALYARILRRRREDVQTT
jgi:DHA3 family tetracycline resistance protein-like MFS transporter